MSRPLRFEFEDAWYHVMNRGVNHQSIYLNDSHRYDFIEMLAQGIELYGIEVHGYCLMNNHYHVLIKTPRGNLSRAMQYINGTYSARFNKRENRDGPLFRGRYKAILVENDHYLYRISRYIHLNPVQAQLVQLPEEYKWSSYLDFLGARPYLLSSLKTHEILLPFDNNEKEYQEYVNQGVDKDTQNFYQKSKTPAIYGGKKFKMRHLLSSSTTIISECAPDYNITNKMLTIKVVMARCSEYFGFEGEVIRSGRAPKFLQARKISVYCCRKLTIATVKEIAGYFSYLSSSRIRQICKEIEQGELLEFAEDVRSCICNL
jgi:putative transposase